MRVTQRMMVESAAQSMSDNLERLNAMREKVASGKQFQRASESPSGVTAALRLRSSLEASQAFLETIQGSDAWMSANDTALRQMTQTATRAITLAQTGVSDTQTEEERQALATEMDGILHQAIGLGNSSHLDSYLFSGFRTTTQPFTPLDNNGDGLYDSVTYHGDDGMILRSIGPGHTVIQNVTGSAAFSSMHQALIQARDALNANDSAQIQAAVGGLQAAMLDVTGAVTTNGIRQREVQAANERLEETQIELKSLLSQQEDVNMAEAISRLNYQETVYQAVLEAGSRAISAVNLFDMLG